MQELTTSAVHDARVASVVSQVQALVSAGDTAHVAKGGVHHVVPLPADTRFRTRPLDTSALRSIISIDTEAKTCTCEPGVTFGELARHTLGLGLLPLVVPELEGITVGGAVAGCSVESMSYRVGGFHDTCVEYEVVTGDGTVLVCSRDIEPDTFERLHGSYGTLGVLTRITFRLTDALPFVRLTHEHHDTFESFDAGLRAHCAQDQHDFVDAIVHAPGKAGRFTICLGDFEDAAPHTSDYRREHIYYRSTLGRDEDHLTTPDYCFRYDTEAHWLTATVPPLEWRWVRRLVGRWFLGSENLIRWSNRLDRVMRLKRRPDVVCDYFVPERTWPEWYSWYEREVDFWPLWVIPYRMPTPYPWIDAAFAARLDGNLFMDCAVYGKRNGRRGVDWSLELERRTNDLGGIKALIGRNHYDRDHFWQIYDEAGYRAAKARLDPHGLFPDVYDKLGRAGD